MKSCSNCKYYKETKNDYICTQPDIKNVSALCVYHGYEYHHYKDTTENKWMDFIKCENCMYFKEDYSHKECTFCDDATHFEPKVELYNADEDCEHEIETQWSGVKCKKCGGWFCY